MDVNDLKERTRWAIIYVADKYNLSNITLGKDLSVNKNTVNNYRRMKTIPNIPFMINFCEKYGFNISWFCYGKGEPYPGARLEYPEVCGEPFNEIETEKPYGAGISEENGLFGRTRHLEKDGHHFDVTTFEPKSGQALDPFIQAIGSLKGIFDFNNPLIISSLQSCIHTLKTLVYKEKQNQELNGRVRKLEDECIDLKRKLEILEEKLNPKIDDEDLKKTA